MTPSDHDNYATELLISLADAPSKNEPLIFIPDPDTSRNAAKAMTAILCHRLAASSQHQPIHRSNTNFQWGNGTFNLRNIADRDYLWTNMRRGVAHKMHHIATSRPAVYLLACCQPKDTSMKVWAVPEPIFYDGLTHLEFEEDGQKYTVQIFADRQRIHGWPASPDLSPFFHELQLSPEEVLAVEAAREMDDKVKQQRKATDGDEEDANFILDSEASTPGDISKQPSEPNVAAPLNQIGLSDEAADDEFTLKDGDERKRIERQICVRRGQQVFRDDLRKRYGDRCLVTGCKVLAVLEAAHIKPYQGEKDNHPENGLLLRADIHTLFDLDLLGIEPKSLRIELHPSLADSAAYKNLAGKTLRCSEKQRPSKDALKLRYERFKERLILAVEN